jgi:two-component system response regulator FixJ
MGDLNMAAVPSLEREDATAQRADGMRRLVHIVDDDSEVRAATSFMLRRHGYETQIYGSGLEFLQQRRLDRGCILLDFRMPEMDGFELLAKLARRDVDLPVIILTGHGDIPLAVRAMKRGAVDFLEKPYDTDRLIGAIERAFALADESRETRQARMEAVAKLKTLTPRESQILQGLRAGMPNKAIARWLALSPRTVEAYRANMMVRIGVTGMSNALRIAADGGLPAIEVAKVQGRPDSR